MKVHLKMIGCRLNQAEIDHMARQLQAQGHEVVTDATEAEQFIVNTCAVTTDATRASRKLIRDLHQANPAAQTTVTGCYAQISPDAVAVLPGVRRVVDNTGKDQIVSSLTGVEVQPFDDEPLTRNESIPGAAGRTRAFVKVQDGCDNACTFCVTTVARGDGLSRPLADVLDEVRYLHTSGYQEAVLTGVHLGSYGHDLGQPEGLKQLVHTILTDTDIPRLRLSSLEPWDIAPGFFRLWDNPRLCRHLHLPLQSGCDATLKRMRRNTSQIGFRQIVQDARAHIAGLSITSDVIVGFPGETDDEFAVSEAFIHEMDFAGLHVFRYSRRPGTPAARMRGHVHKDAQKARSSALIAHATTQAERFATAHIGQDVRVLWEQVAGATADGFINVGYTDNYVRVRGIHPRPLTNLITSAQGIAYDTSNGQLITQISIQE